MIKSVLLSFILALVICMLASSIEIYDKATMEKLEKVMAKSEHLKQDIKELEDVDENEIDRVRDKERLYFFKLHDTNKDDKLDGLEILHALQHDHVASRNATIEELAEMVEENMRQYDSDHDGTISSTEFLTH